MNKKIIYIVLLIILVVAIILFFALQGNFKIDNTNNSNVQQILGTRNANEIQTTAVNESIENTVTTVSNAANVSNTETIVTELDDGTLYSFTGEPEKADVVIKDNYFDTQINEIMLNYNNYKGKTVEIEGMYIDVYNPYTIVGRYSTNNLCAYCPVGYSAFEYIWNGEKIDAENEKNWIKVIGKFCVGNDETSSYQDYYYIEASSVEVMNEAGLKTVSN